MGLYCNEAEGDRLVEGLKDCMACIHQGRNTMEVWSDDAELFYGFLPATATPEMIHAAVEFYTRGHESGIEEGASCARAMMRRAMGLAD